MIELFTVIANKVGISVSLLLAVCTAESGLRNVNNFSDPRGGSHGQCQLNGHTARMILPYADRLAIQQPEVNVLIAAMYLKKLQDKYIFDELTIASYNSGRPIYVNSKLINLAYVNKVLAIRENYNE